MLFLFNGNRGAEMKERLTEQEKRSREKKLKIYRITMKMFSEYGYEQTTIRDICKEAGITTSTFYNFFGDKDGVLLQFYYEMLEKGAKYLDLTPLNLKTPYQSICNFFMSTAAFMDSFSKDVARQATFAAPKLVRGNYKTLPPDNANKAIEAFLEEGKRYGTVSKATDSKKTAEYLIMSASGLSSYWINQDDDRSYMDIAKDMVPLIFRSVTKEKVVAQITK